MLRKFYLVSFMVMCIAAGAAAADNLKDAFTQGSVKGNVRTLHFTRDFDTANTRRDFAVGGTLYYRTAELYGVSLGVALSTTHDIDSDDDDSVYSVLGADENGNHKNVTREQEYFIQGNWFNTVIKYGAQEINTPYLNTDDVRMMPRTYKGLSVVNNSFESLTLSAYYLTDSMGWNDEEFVSISQAVANEPGGASFIEDKDMLILGANYKLPFEAVKGNIEGWYYTINDIFNITYLKASLNKDFGAVNLYFVPSVLFQKSQGDELNGELDTHQIGFRAGIKYAGFDVMGTYSNSGDDGMITPWGFDKIIAQQVMTSATRGDEDAWGLKAGYDFSKIGLKGLSAYVWYASYDVDETATVKDIEETDFNIQYAFSGALEGLGVRYRYADMHVSGGESLSDTRIYLTYQFAFSGR
ncbi:hypothetical protein ADMFC3_18790 [Geovibrio sp. ADMFC3]